MANNNNLFNAVIAGAGGGNQQRWITDPNAGDYASFVTTVTTIATLIDSMIAPIPGDANIAQSTLMQSIVQNVFAGRYVQINVDAAYESLAEAIVALYTQLATTLVEPTSGGSVAPIPGTYWIDPFTAVPLADQDGSASAPFATVLQAFNTLVAYAADREAYTAGTMILCDGPYSEEEFPTITWNVGVTPFLRWINLIGFGNAFGTSAWVVTGDGDETTLNVINLSGAFGPALSFNAISGFVSLRLHNSWIHTIEGEGLITAVDSRCFEAIACTAFTGTNCNLNGAIITAVNQVILDNCDVQSVVGSDLVTIRNSRVGDTLETTGGGIILENVEVSNGGFTSNGDCTIRQSLVNGDISVSGSLSMDTFSYAYLSAASRTLTTDFNVLIDPPQYVIGGLTVTVPTLASAEIGYANVSIAGTTFANVITTADPILAYPTADLAGGALLNARMLNDTTARLCFIGPHPGGDETIAIARMR